MGLRCLLILSAANVLLLSSGEGKRIRYEVSRCESGDPEGCEQAAVSFAGRGSAKAELFETRFRTLALEKCAKEKGEPREEVVCAIRQLWWSEDSATQAKGVSTLAALCANPPPDFSEQLSMNGDHDRMATPRGCLSLGDAYVLGRGMKADPEAARRLYERGCAGGPDNDNSYRNHERRLRDGKTVAGPALFFEVARAETPREYAERNRVEFYDHPTDLNAVDANCRRLARPSSLFEEKYASAAVHLVLPSGATRVAQARTLLAKGENETAIWLLKSVAGSARKDDPRDEAAALLKPLADKQATDRWKASVQPHLQAFHFLRALEAAKQLVATYPSDETFRTRLATTSKDAVAHHRTEATRSGPLVAAVHGAIARKIDPTLPAATPIAAKGSGLPPPIALSALPADCAWLSDLLPRAFETTKEGIPVRLSVACTHISTLETPIEVPHKYYETAYRKEMGEVDGPIITEKEDYKCIQPKRVPNANRGWDTIQVWATCQRDKYIHTRIPGEVTVAYQAEKMRIETRQSRTLVAELRGSLQVGDRPLVPFTTKKVLQETSSRIPGGPNVDFTSATLDTVDVNAANELASAIRDQLTQIDRARDQKLAQDHEQSVAQSIARLADKPSAERDEAFIAGLLLDKAPPAATIWLDERFGITPAELRQMLGTR